MTVIDAFKDIFNSVYSGENQAEDIEIALDRFFPKDITQHGVSTFRELEERHNRSRTAFGNAINRHLIPHLINLSKNDNDDKEFLRFKQQILELYEKISQFGNCLSLTHLISLSEVKRSLAGLVILGDNCGIARDFHIVYIDRQGFIVPNIISTDQLSKCQKSAKGAAKYFGSIYPFDQLYELKNWDLIPIDQILRFSRELLSSENDLKVFSNDYFGLDTNKANTILTQLIKIYSIYDSTVDDNLELSLVRTLKKKIISSSSLKLKDPSKRLAILNACSVYFVDYCSKMEWCEIKDYLILGSQKLKNIINDNPPQDKEQKKFYEIEKQLVTVLRKNGKPMSTAEFIPEMDAIGANKPHEQEFSFLFYRKGTQYKSTYHTLDDNYENDLGEKQIVNSVDRVRIEINRIIRNSTISKIAKQICEYQCQICGDRIEIGEKEFYAEAHHLKPLGIPHNGPDILGNILCVCPNCHVQLDYGSVLLDKAKIRNFEKNPIDDLFLNYHNNVIFIGKDTRVR